MNDIRVRFAPSPTGFLHIGGLRTALYDYLVSKGSNGKLILRVEDTDQNRKVEGAVENLIDTFYKLGIEFDEGPHIGGAYGPYVQSQRLELYHKYATYLRDKGFAYPCFCSSETLEQMREDLINQKLFPKYDRRCLSLSEHEINKRIDNGDKYVLRLKMPNSRTFTIEDEIRGKVEIDTNQLDDQVIIKSDGFPTYHLAAVVDDHLMEISHVIRGEEWLSSTPKHIYLYECFGWICPKWVHLPLILNTDKSKLSKRMNDVSVNNYLEKGYIKEALLNFVALLGWHGTDDRELYSLEELCKEFSLERVNKAGAVFDLTKLDWMNGHYIRNLPLEYIADLCRYFFIDSGIDISDNSKFLKVINTARNYITLIPEILNHSIFYYVDLELHPDDFMQVRNDSAHVILKWYLEKLNTIDDTSKEKLSELVNYGMKELNIKGKEYYHPLRLALISRSSGPDVPTIIEILGIPESIKRITRALNQ